MVTVRRGIIERFDKIRTDHHRYIRAHILKNQDMEEGKLQQYIVSFHRAKDHTYHSNFNFKASKLVFNHRKEMSAI